VLLVRPHSWAALVYLLLEPGLDEVHLFGLVLDLNASKLERVHF